MTARQLADRALNIARNYKTLYVMGCFGAPLNAANRTRYSNNHSYNRRSDRRKMIQAATADTFGFDCVCLIKAILWGWTGDTSRSYGGAKYASNGVPDIGADTMITRCSCVSAGGWKTMQVGEALWMPGHIGIYIGSGLAVECSPKWANCVQVTAVGNIGKKAGYNTRTWTKHGLLPYVLYDGQGEPEKEVEDLTQAETDARIKALVPDIAKQAARAVIAELESERMNAPLQAWAESEHEEAIARGITDGARPQDYATRAEAAIMAKRAVDGVKPA